jgi:hypothetical protein
MAMEQQVLRVLYIFFRCFAKIIHRILSKGVWAVPTTVLSRGGLVLEVIFEAELIVEAEVIIFKVHIILEIINIGLISCLYDWQRRRERKSSAIFVDCFIIF